MDGLEVSKEVKTLQNLGLLALGEVRYTDNCKQDLPCYFHVNPRHLVKPFLKSGLCLSFALETIKGKTLV